jgi:hypothetical protein
MRPVSPTATVTGFVSTTLAIAISAGQENLVTSISVPIKIALAQTAPPFLLISTNVLKTAVGMVLASTNTVFVTLAGLDWLVTFNVAQVILSVYLVTKIAVVMVYVTTLRLALVNWAGLAMIAPFCLVFLIAMTMAFVETVHVFATLDFWDLSVSLGRIRVTVTAIVQDMDSALFRILCLILIPSNVSVTSIGMALTAQFHHVTSSAPEMVHAIKTVRVNVILVGLA